MSPPQTFESLEKLVELTGDLSTDLMQHVSFYYQVAIECTRAQAFADEQKQQLGYTESAVQLLIRQEAEANGIKTTEDKVKAATRTHPDYVQAIEAQFQAQRVYGEFLALRSAFEARRFILHDLTTLNTQGVGGDSMARYNDTKAAMAAKRVPLKKP